MAHPQQGISEKLKRADESLRRLNAETLEFLQGYPDGVIPDGDYKGIQEEIELLSQAEVPLRFSVLAGEIIHHFRSCFDHMAWLLSSNEYRIQHPRRIEFPIYVTAPEKKQRKKFDGTIKGITSAHALKLIEELQPYHRPVPSDDPLAIIQDMDNSDKHRELLIFIPTTKLSLDFRIHDMQSFHELVQKTELSSIDYAAFSKAMDVNTKVSAQVAFREFGKQENQPVIQSLFQLGGFVRDTVLKFLDEAGNSK